MCSGCSRRRRRDKRGDRARHLADQVVEFPRVMVPLTAVVGFEASAQSLATVGGVREAVLVERREIFRAIVKEGAVVLTASAGWMMFALLVAAAVTERE